MEVDVPLDPLWETTLEWPLACLIYHLSGFDVLKPFTIYITSYSSKNKDTPPLDTQRPLECDKLSPANCLCRFVIPM